MVPCTFMEKRRVGAGSTWDADYAPSWDDFPLVWAWDDGYVTQISGRPWVVVVA